MSISTRLKEYLEHNHVPYTHCTHRPAYTAQEVAATMHVPGREMAKTLVLKADGRFILVVVSAVSMLNIGALRECLPYKRIEFSSEEEFSTLFPDADVGAMSPFGNLYGLPVYVDMRLAEDEEIVFNAGTHVETIRMKYSDFAQLVQPEVIDAVASIACG